MGFNFHANKPQLRKKTTDSHPTRAQTQSLSTLVNGPIYNSHIEDLYSPRHPIANALFRILGYWEKICPSSIRNLGLVGERQVAPKELPGNLLCHLADDDDDANVLSALGIGTSDGLSSSALSTCATALDDSIISQSKLDGADVVLAYLAKDPSFQQPPEALFRSLSLVAIDNTISEWSFANHFFGQLSSGTQQVPGSESTLFPNTSRLDLGPASVSDSSTPMIRKGSFVSSIADSDSYLIGSPSKMNSNSGMIFFSFFELPIPQTQVTTLALFPDIHK
ncbi:hypothetical protein PGTUg99_031445 [Puccinia graminis f. sp. tritici]|uniref:Uncharacterized protein n=1 Tax=Puccinia graminis f. sp. tritici TaxID=56615 RepID=A0A5B0PPW9_PUCGR|nr:hypothetical protein PGTUg99_031445 [Puccinia graminis f. sp. tritici]